MEKKTHQYGKLYELVKTVEKLKIQHTECVIRIQLFQNKQLWFDYK